MKTRFQNRSGRTLASPAKNPDGFTLVEMLIVLGIVIVLASLLFSSLGKTNEKAKQAKSIGNLKAIGGALGLYMADNQNTFPASCNVSYTGDFWCDTLAPYLPAPVTLNKFNTADRFSISRALVDPLLQKDRHHPQGDYAANSDLFWGPTGWPQTTKPVSAYELGGRLSKVVAVMSAESTSRTPPCGSWYLNRREIVNGAPTSWSSSRPADRGTGAYLCLFADLHVEAIAKEDFHNRRADLLSLQLP